MQIWIIFALYQEEQNNGCCRDDKINAIVFSTTKVWMVMIVKILLEWKMQLEWSSNWVPRVMVKHSWSWAVVLVCWLCMMKCRHNYGKCMVLLNQWDIHIHFVCILVFFLLFSRLGRLTESSGNDYPSASRLLIQTWLQEPVSSICTYCMCVCTYTRLSVHIKCTCALSC